MSNPDAEHAGHGGLVHADRASRLAGREGRQRDAVDLVARLNVESPVPVRSHGSLSLNWARMAAGLVDRVQVTIFRVITGRTGTDPVPGGAADFDLELLEHRRLDSDIQELVYRPTPHLHRTNPS